MDNICRGCLAADKTYIVQNADYEVFYQQITNVPFQDGSGKPTSLCYECLYLFRKCVQLRDKCLRADRVLNDFIENGEEISRESILKINRDELLLSSKCTITKLRCIEIGPDCMIDVKIENDNYELYENRAVEVKLEGRQSQYQQNNESNTNIDHCSDDDTELNVLPFLTCEVKIENDYSDVEEDMLPESMDVFENKRLIKQENKQYEDKDNCNVSSVKEEVIVDHLISGLERVCTVCNFKCLEQDVFEKHLKSHKHITEQLSGSKSGLKRGGGESKQVVYTTDDQIKLAGGKMYQCDVCSFKCPIEYNLIRHKKIHSGQKHLKSYNCDFCGYQSVRKYRLVNHIRKHTGDKPYECNICSVRFADNELLAKHVRTHTQGKPHKCNFCNYQGEKLDLVRHLRTHTGEKPYACELCDYKSSQKGNLERHIRKHTGEKPYKCNLCNYESSERMSLTLHKSVHTGEKPFKCDLCNYESAYKGHLLKHRKTHTRETPSYKCDFCIFTTKNKKKLKVHQKIHVGLMKSLGDVTVKMMPGK